MTIPPESETLRALTLEERYPVVKGTWLDGKLVFHCREEGYTRYLDGDGHRLRDWSDSVVRWEVRTRCGLLLDWWTRDTDNNGRYTSLRRDYAEAIGVPCKRCFPDG